MSIKEDYKKFDKFYNIIFRECYILDMKKDLYLVYLSNNTEHFAVTSYISLNDGSLVGSRYFKDIESALECFKKIN